MEFFLCETVKFNKFSLQLYLLCLLSRFVWSRNRVADRERGNVDAEKREWEKNFFESIKLVSHSMKLEQASEQQLVEVTGTSFLKNRRRDWLSTR